MRCRACRLMRLARRRCEAHAELRFVNQGRGLMSRRRVRRAGKFWRATLQRATCTSAWSGWHRQVSLLPSFRRTVTIKLRLDSPCCPLQSRSTPRSSRRLRRRHGGFCWPTCRATRYMSRKRYFAPGQLQLNDTQLDALRPRTAGEPGDEMWPEEIRRCALSVPEWSWERCLCCCINRRTAA